MGKGNPSSKLIFIGEAPGNTEDRTGIPFTGKSGNLLQVYFNIFNYTLENSYVTNIIKCRPYGYDFKNRQPTETEILNCSEYLLDEVRVSKPKIIVTLGAVALNTLLPRRERFISHVHGVPIKFGKNIIFPMYHPSYILRNKEKRVDMFYDFQKLTTEYRYRIDMFHETNY